MRLLLVAGVCLGIACGSSLPLTEATDASTGDAAVDASAPPTDAAKSDAPLPLGCLRLPTWTLPALKPSLPVTPKLLWRKPLMPNWGVTGFLVRSGNQLAFSARQLHVFDLTGTLLWSTDYPSFDVSVGSVSADTEGNYYQFADKLYSYDSAGVKRYSVDFGDTSQGGDTFSPAPIVRGADDLFFHSVDGFVRRLDARTGARKWETPAEKKAAGVRAVAGVLVDANRGALWSIESGKPSQASSNGKRYFPLAAVSNGALWAHQVTDVPSSTNVIAVDGCFHPLRPESTVAGGMAVIDAAERFWETWIDGGSLKFAALTLNSVSAPSLAGPPSLVGADGTIYGMSIGGGTPATTLISWTRSDGASDSLVVEGKIAYPTLGDDGVLHALSQESDGIYLVAVQTRSPGLADGPYPMLRVDNRRSGWPKAH